MLLCSLLIIFAPVSEQAGELILLAPSSVFEGDPIVLMCQNKNNWKIKTVTYYKNKKEVFSSSEVLNFTILSAVLRDSGTYHCAATYRSRGPKKASRTVEMKVQELFPRPVLTARPYRPTEGSPVTLTCETWLSPQRSDVQLQFCFFRDNRVLESGWSISPQLQIPIVWNEDSGSYWCQVETTTHSVSKQSPLSQIQVQRVPVSNVSLQIKSPGGQVIEGGSLILLCSVAEGTGNITFSWHRGAAGYSVGKKTQHSLSAELDVPTVKVGDAGDYYCRADNGHDPIQSTVVNIPVKIPVSHPVLTLRAPAQASVGDMVELHCEAQRGSPPILYRFYCEEVILGNSSAPSGGVSFNLSLTAEHSGNYSCEADNGLGTQRSEMVPLSISGTAAYGRDLVTARVLGGLFGILGFIAVTLLFYCWPKTSGGTAAMAALREASSPNLPEPTCSSPLPEANELQPVYVNVDSVGVDVVYSQVVSIQYPEGSANTRRAFLEDQGLQVIYSDVKKT